MKRSLATCVLTLFCLGSALAGCSAAQAPARADLLNRHFELVSVDGKAFTSTTSRKPNLEFTEGFRISGGICNRFTGQAELTGNTITAKNMASTRMFCPDDALNQLEQMFSAMLMHGASLDLTGTTLTLQQGGHTLVYTLRDPVR